MEEKGLKGGGDGRVSKCYRILSDLSVIESFTQSLRATRVDFHDDLISLPWRITVALCNTNNA